MNYIQTPFVGHDFVVRKTRQHVGDRYSSFTYVWDFLTWVEANGFKTKANGTGFASKAEAVNAAHVAFYGLVFEAEVRDYTGSLDVSDITTCVDCGRSIHFSTFDIGGAERCPRGDGWGHRVLRDSLENWEHLVKVAAAKAALMASQDA
jgi:hypothetical protein